MKLSVIAEDSDGGTMHDECAEPLAGGAIQVADAFGIIVIIFTEGP